MKKYLIIGVIALLFSACNDGNDKEQEVRYTQDSEEINSLKSLIDNYEKANWDQYRTHYSDTAKLYYNSTKSIRVNDAISQHQENNSPLSSYEFVDEQDEYEMVVTDDGETWVNYWGLWHGTISENDSTIEIPVHITARFADGKIVSEHVYFDNSGIMMAMNELEAARMDQDSIQN